MSAPSNSKAAAPASSTSGEKGGFYLQPRTKVWILGLCLALMIAASAYAVLQSLNPDPLDTSLSARLRYPHETNPYARLQAVRCANDYACRLNSVAVNGTGDLPEAWAVGNVGLVLHRKAGQSQWEQLTITAKEENALSPMPTPTATPVAKPTATPRSSPRPAQSATPASTPALSPTPTATPTPVPSPTPATTVVPNLIGLTEQEARKAAGSFPLRVEYDKASASSSMTQQGPPPDLRVINQSPPPNSVVAPGTAITVTLGRPRSKANLILDKLVPRVYAAEPEKQSSPAQQSNSTSAPSGQTPPPATQHSSLDDDLIKVDCNQLGCDVLGRSGRIWIIQGNQDWRSGSIFFTDVNGHRMEGLVLLSAPSSDAIVAKSGSSLYRCRHFVQGVHLCSCTRWRVRDS